MSKIWTLCDFVAMVGTFANRYGGPAVLWLDTD